MKTNCLCFVFPARIHVASFIWMTCSDTVSLYLRWQLTVRKYFHYFTLLLLFRNLQEKNIWEDSIKILTRTQSSTCWKRNASVSPMHCAALCPARGLVVENSCLIASLYCCNLLQLFSRTSAHFPQMLPTSGKIQNKLLVFNRKIPALKP